MSMRRRRSTGSLISVARARPRPTGGSGASRSWHLEQPATPGESIFVPRLCDRLHALIPGQRRVSSREWALNGSVRSSGTFGAQFGNHLVAGGFCVLRFAAACRGGLLIPRSKVRILHGPQRKAPALGAFPVARRGGIEGGVATKVATSDCVLAKPEMSDSWMPQRQAPFVSLDGCGPRPPESRTSAWAVNVPGSEAVATGTSRSCAAWARPSGGQPRFGVTGRSRRPLPRLPRAALVPLVRADGRTRSAREGSLGPAAPRGPKAADHRAGRRRRIRRRPVPPAAGRL